MSLKTGFNECNNQEYHGDRSFYSSSALKILLKDKYMFYRKYILNEKMEEKVNHNFTFGSLVHGLILEPHLVNEEFAVYSGSKNTEAFKEFKKQNKGKEIITPTAWQNGQFLLQRAQESSNFKFVQGGEPEKTLCGKLHGMPIKVRADYIGKDYILDVKTTSGNISDLYNIEKACANYGYALSSALYFDMFKKKVPKLKRFLFWFINKQSGDEVLVQASEEFLEYGRKQYKEAIKIYKEAVKNDSWEDSLPLIYPKY